MNSSTHQSLSVPLIGTLSHEADVECQQQQEATPCCCSNEEDTSLDRFLTFLQPVLLIAQFGSALAFGRAENNNTVGLDFKQVFGSILVFALNCLIFQRTVRIEKIRCLLVVLIPELSTLFVCALVYYHRMYEAFVTLVASTMLMALFIIVASVHLLVTDKDEEEDDNENMRSEQATAILVL